jgi:iron complex transport system ATP-binding protein
VMRQGSIIANGSPAEILDADVVLRAFGLSALVVPDPLCGSPMVVPRGRFHGMEAVLG